MKTFVVKHFCIVCVIFLMYRIELTCISFNSLQKERDGECKRGVECERGIESVRKAVGGSDSRVDSVIEGY